MNPCVATTLQERITVGIPAYKHIPQKEVELISTYMIHIPQLMNFTQHFVVLAIL